MIVGALVLVDVTAGIADACQSYRIQTARRSGEASPRVSQDFREACFSGGNLARSRSSGAADGQITFETHSP
jgi:hypothetical protein